MAHLARSKSKKQNTSLELWVLTVSTEELEKVRFGLSERALTLSTPPLTSSRTTIAKEYRKLNRSISTQLEAQR